MTMKRDDIERILEALGSAPMAPPDARTVDRIENRWRAASSGMTQQHASRRRPVMLAGLGLAACAAAVAVGIVVNRSGTDDVVVTAAEDIVIVLPSGEFVNPEPGEAVPEGAFVQGGPYAAGRIGNNLVGPDDIFVVVNGHLKKADVDALTAATPASSLAESSAPAESISEISSQRSAVPATPATIAAPTPAPTAEPTTTSTTVVVAEAPTTVSVESTDAATVPVKEARRPSALRVTASRDGDVVVVSWRKFAGPAFRRYVVYRVRSWDGGSTPTNGRIGAVGERTATEFVDSNPKLNTTYVVVALGPEQAAIAWGSVKTPFTSSGSVATDPSTSAPTTTG